jgi:hypothetical protein
MKSNRKSAYKPIHDTSRKKIKINKGSQNTIFIGFDYMREFHRKNPAFEASNIFIHIKKK